MLIITFTSLAIFKIATAILSALVASMSAVITLCILSAFAGIGLLLVPSPAAKRWAIPVFLIAVVACVAVEILPSYSGVLAIVLAAAAGIALLVWAKIRTFKFLKSSKGTALPTWAKWVLRLI